MQIYTASIKSDLGIIESLSRASQNYIPHGVKGSTQSLHRVFPRLQRVYTESIQSLYRVYTESTQSNTESTQLMQVLESLLQIIMVRN